MNYDALCIHCFHEKNSRNEVCPYCGFDPKNYCPQRNHLRPYTILHGEYLLGEVVGHGGFGIVYRAFDLNLHSMVAIKELFPTGLMTRICDSQPVSMAGLPNTPISAVYMERPEYIDEIREKFVREARTLAKLESRQGDEGIVRVHALFSENGTDYMVMEFLEGQSLKEYLKVRPRIEWNHLLEMLKPCMNALILLHNQGIIHRDISPDNIMILKTTERLKLLDFGNVKINYSDPESSSTKLPTIKKGYSPIEQYSESGRVGPETDVYALCATIYKCVTGTVPPEPAEAFQSGIKQISEYGVTIPAHCEAALMRGLSLKAEDRFHSVADLMSVLYEQEEKYRGEASKIFNKQPAGSEIDNAVYNDSSNCDDYKLSSEDNNGDSVVADNSAYTLKNRVEEREQINTAEKKFSAEKELSGEAKEIPFPDFSGLDEVEQRTNIFDKDTVYINRQIKRIIAVFSLIPGIIVCFFLISYSLPADDQSFTEESLYNHMSEKAISDEQAIVIYEGDDKTKGFLQNTTEVMTGGSQRASNDSAKAVIQKSSETVADESQKESYSHNSENQEIVTRETVQSEHAASDQIPGNIIAWATTRLNVRTGPGTEYERCGQLKENQGAIVVGEIGRWKEIVFSVHDIEKDELSTIHGYASGNYLNLEQYFSALSKSYSVESLTGMADNYYYNGDIADHFKKAADWYLAAAEKGNVYAQYSIGYMYSKGEGVKKDYTQAISWLKKAADQKQQGSEAAQELLDSL